MPNPISIFPDGISGYEPIAFCGFGAYGSVWLVKDETGRQHALKVIDKETLQEKEMRGLEASSRITNCPNLLQIHHVGHFDGGVFYTMEPGDNAGTKERYVPDTLAQRLKDAPNGLPLAEVRQLAIDLLKALAQLHTANLVHRDLKPENILYVGGQPKLSDLGLLRSLSLTVSIGGTLGYIPPDKLVQAANSPQFNLRADASDDLYAMGKLLYCALTGNAPEDFPSVPSEKMKDAEYRRFFKVLLFACGNRPYPHRFDTAEHFLEAIQCGKLPRRRTWLIWLLLLLLVPAIAYVCIPHQQKPESKAENAVVQDNSATQSELEADLARTFHIELQLSKEKYAQIEELISSAKAQIGQKDYNAAQKTIAALNKSLAEEAQMQIPQDKGDDFLYTANILGYLQSPLAKYLPNKKRNSLHQHATNLTKKLSAPDTPNLGSLFHARYLSAPIRMPFVPPGKFLSNTTKHIEEIPYPFWIYERQVTNYQYMDSMHSLNSPDARKDMPVLLMSWYDILSYCDNVTNSLKMQNQLPPGYAIRPPTMAEWEYAAQGGWAGESPKRETIKDSVFNIKTPNKLGIYGMGSIFKEYMIAGSPEDFSQVVARNTLGDSKNKSPKRYAFKRNALNVPQTTFRPVLAPTPPDFFVRELSKMPDELMTAVIEGRHYAGICTFAANLNFTASFELATSLKAQLAEPSSMQEWSKIFSHISDQPAFPAYIGAHWKNNAWRHLSDNAPLEIPGIKPPPDNETTALSGTKGAFAPRNPSLNLPTLILTWKNDQDWNTRNQLWRNGTAKNVERQFTVAGRNFTLLHCRIGSSSVEALCKLAGARPAVLSDQTVRQAVMQELKDYDMPIFVGARRICNAWCWLDGANTKIPGRIQRLNDFHSPVNSISLEMLALYQGKLCAVSFTNYILLEFTE